MGESNADLEWVPAVGEEVVIARPGRDETATLTLTKILKIGKRDVVCEDGSRWSLTRLRDGHIAEAYHGDRAWTPRSALYPANAERVAGWREANRHYNRRLRLQRAADGLVEAVRHQTVSQKHIDAVVEAWAAAQNGSDEV